ncbi:MAG: hypothetical protein ABIU05_16685, partial [Nitrospirales bacterium]
MVQTNEESFKIKVPADLPGLIWSRMHVRLDRNREVTVMPRTRYTPEEVIQHLWTVELVTHAPTTA